MKKIILLSFLCFLVLLPASLQAREAYSMTLNGSTGIITAPTAHVAWEAGLFAIDFGYHFQNSFSPNMAHLPKVTFTLFKRWEIGACFEIADNDGQNDNLQDFDFIGHTKVQLFGANREWNTGLAIGGNFQYLAGENNNTGTWAGEAYLVATYVGKFFQWPAETSLSLGYPFGPAPGYTNINFAMGFDLYLFPKVFKDYVHLLIDFGNYYYSWDPFHVDDNRGYFNTGIRIDIPVNPLKLHIDALFLDILDSSRCFTVGVSFGFPVVK